MFTAPLQISPIHSLLSSDSNCAIINVADDEAYLYGETVDGAEEDTEQSTLDNHGWCGEKMPGETQEFKLI